jgi:hypothetical protein
MAMPANARTTEMSLNDEVLSFISSRASEALSAQEILTW